MNQPLTLRTAIAVLVITFISFNYSAAAQLALQLTASNYNGYNVSCFGGTDGSIDLTVTGGTPPYTYNWSTGSLLEDINGLAANYYSVEVSDAGSSKLTIGITLTEPGALVISGSLNEYANGYNISCFQCSNGIVAINMAGGVSPYSYLWNDNNPSQVHYSMGAGTYSVLVSDANGCTISSEHYYLTEPPKSNWAMDGNTGSNPPTEFIGTGDNKDLVFKANNTERLRLKSNGVFDIKGGLKIDTASADSIRLAFVDENGMLRTGPGGGSLACSWPTNHWRSNHCTSSNDIYNYPFTGKVGIGLIPDASSTSKLQVDGTIAAREVKVTLNTFPDYVFENSYKLLSLKELESFISLNKHLPEIPSANEVMLNKGIELGDMQTKLLQKIEELTLYIIDQDKKIEELQKTVKGKK
jgi:hypothetical protein